MVFSIILFVRVNSAYSMCDFLNPPCNLSYTASGCCDPNIYNCAAQKSACESSCNSSFETAACLIGNCSCGYSIFDTYCSNSSYTYCSVNQECVFINSTGTCQISDKDCTDSSCNACYNYYVGQNFCSSCLNKCKSNCQTLWTPCTYFTINASTSWGPDMPAGVTPGTISPFGSVSVAKGSNYTFTINHGQCYPATVYVDNISVGNVSSYTFPNVTANHTIHASFTVITYTISVILGPGGAMATTGQPTCGQNQTYNIYPYTGYHIADVKVDNVSVGPVSSYTFFNLSGNHIIHATFELNKYRVQSWNGPHGFIYPSPTETVLVTHGSNTSFNVFPETGYHVESVTGCGGAWSGNTFALVYTTGAIMNDCNVSATFAPNPTIVINNGAEFTNSTSVNLALACYDAGGCTEMKFSNDYTNWSSSEPFATTKVWSLDPGDGRKWVFAMVKYASLGIWSGAVLDDIELDTVPPTGSLSINNGALSTDMATVTLTIDASDSASGVSSMQFSNDNQAWSSSEPFTNRRLWNLAPGSGPKTVYARFKDAAGNWSTAQYSANITLNSVPRIDAGGYHGAVLPSDGSLFTWGRNQYGQIGDGSIDNKNAPVRIREDIQWGGISTGGGHTAALKSDNALWDWGWNNNGQLGDGSTTDTHLPEPVATDKQWRVISAGLQHTAAVRTDNTLWSWGSNTYGQVGDGTSLTSRSTPTQIMPANQWAMVDGGDSHTLALTTNGVLWAWGRNLHGELGNGTTVESDAPISIATPTTLWVAVAAGGYHSAAVKSDGTLWAWGYNNYGQLGYATSPATENHSPQQIGADNVWLAVAAGENHTVALNSNGTLWSWGNNASGQLGYDTSPSTQSQTPQQVGQDTDWIAIAAGTDYTIALKSDETVWAWGGNAFGQLGDGTNIPKSTPALAIELRPKLTLTKAGHGTGRVTSSPAGIDCDGTCSSASATYALLTSVTLSAATDSCMRFAGWSGGGCTGTGTCTIPLRSSVTVTAIFSWITPTADFIVSMQTRTGLIVSAPPAANLSDSAPYDVHFTDQSMCATEWHWDSGDNDRYNQWITSEERNPSRSYRNVGNFPVTLTARNPDASQTKRKDNLITAVPCPNNPAKIGDTFYETITEAISSALSGSTIQLLAVDFTAPGGINESVGIKKALSLDGSYNCWYTYKITGPTAIKGNVTIQDGAFAVSMDGISVH
jgi:alpha-tubulin suppressor-like RCC1 family protein